MDLKKKKKKQEIEYNTDRESYLNRKGLNTDGRLK